MAKKIRWTYEYTQQYLDKRGNSFPPRKAGDIDEIKYNHRLQWTTDDFDGVLSQYIKEGLYVWYIEEEDE